MNKTLFAALFLSAGALSAQAQISAGTKLLTGSIGYSQQMRETSNNTPNSQPLELKNKQFNITPGVGYFIADNLALGLQGNALLTSNEGYTYSGFPAGYNKTESKTRALSGGVFGRYYKFVGEKVAMYGQLGGGYQNVYYSNSVFGALTNSNGNREQGFYAGLLPGLVFFPTDKIGLELTLRGISYNRLTIKDEEGSQTSKQVTSNLNFGFGLSDLNLGISLYLGRN